MYSIRQIYISTTYIFLFLFLTNCAYAERDQYFFDSVRGGELAEFYNQKSTGEKSSFLALGDIPATTPSAWNEGITHALDEQFSLDIDFEEGMQSKFISEPRSIRDGSIEEGWKRFLI